MRSAHKHHLNKNSIGLHRLKSQINYFDSLKDRGQFRVCIPQQILPLSTLSMFFAARPLLISSCALPSRALKDKSWFWRLDFSLISFFCSQYLVGSSSSCFQQECASSLHGKRLKARCPCVVLRGGRSQNKEYVARSQRLPRQCDSPVSVECDHYTGRKKKFGDRIQGWRSLCKQIWYYQITVQSAVITCI